MAAGDDERDRRKRIAFGGKRIEGRFRAQEGRVDVRVDMGDTDQRQVPCESEGLRRGEADEDRADQSWAVSDGDGVEPRGGAATFLDRSKPLV